MLQSIHDKAKGILGIVIVAFLALVFGLWGIGDYLTGATEKFAASVDGVEITQSEFERGLAKQRQRMDEMFKGQIPDSPVFQQRMKEQVLEQLVARQVLQKMVKDGGYRVADSVLAYKIKNMKAFQQEGAFNNASYKAIVQSQGMAVKEFENLFRNDLTIQQLQNAITGSSIIGPAELNILNRIQQQSRDINFLQFDDAQYVKDITVTDEQINEYFELNKARYMHPETVTISYVEITSADLSKDIPTDDEAVRRLYDDYVASLASKEQRKARHILVNLSEDADADTQQKQKAAIDDLLARINKGESFEALAKEHSDDPGSATKGGDLGWVSRGMMVPEFETALFKLKKGEVSAVVKSFFGYHIIRFDESKAEEVASFKSKQPELVKQYQAQLLEDGFYEKSELMATTAYENDQSLQEVADALGLEIKTIPAFSRNRGAGIASNDKVRKAAFDPDAISEGRNSDVIELAKDHVLVLRVDTHTQAKAKKLEEVKSLISSAIKAEKAREKAQASALETLVKLQQGESIDSEVFKANAKLTKLGSVKRDHTGVSRQVLNEAFTMAKPAMDKAVYKVVELATGAAVIELNAVTAPEKATVEQLEVLSKQFQSEQSNRDMAVIMEYLKSQSKIIRSEEL